MEDIKLGSVETNFANIIWKHAPLSSRQLVELCEAELNWKRTTTYTVLKKLCEKGMFQHENRVITVLVSKEEFYAMQCEQFVDEQFQGSLYELVKAFTTRRELSLLELENLRQWIQQYDR